MAMNPVLIQSALHIDQEKEWGMSYLTSVENCYKELHYHDFYELLLITQGKIINDVNGSETILEKGSLVYLRPRDTHQLKQYGKEGCQFINLTFLDKTTRELWNYMGEDLDSSLFNCSRLPLCLVLSENQLNEIIGKLHHLNTISGSNKKLSRSILRMMLVELFFKYLPLVWQESGNKLPGWLNKLCEEIKQQEIYNLSVKTMLYLTGKNHSYLCRAFKKYLSTTPTGYINRIRLNYAENLLLNSDISIAQICFETGFESLSHFYNLFEQRYLLSPLKYRKKYWSSIHRWS
jgi:AraC-type DNA-binding domain-containing proteins